MAKKKKHPEHENLERWLVSYADFITLLFATFTALYALSQTDIAKFKKTGDAIREGFQEQSLISGVKSIIRGQTQAENPLNDRKGGATGILDKFESMTYRPGEIKAMTQTAANIQNDLKAINEDLKNQKGGEDSGEPIRPVEVSVQERGIRISFDSRLLFDPGSVSLKQSARKALDVVGNRLKTYKGNIIQVEGHTDSLPISSALFPSNWELSAARSGSVARYMIASQDMTPSGFVVVGYGDTQPLTSNKTASGRAMNRRVDLLLLNKNTSELEKPQTQYMRETTIPVKSVSSETPQPPVDPHFTPIRSGGAKPNLKQEKDRQEGH